MTAQDSQIGSAKTPIPAVPLEYVGISDEVLPPAIRIIGGFVVVLGTLNLLSIASLAYRLLPGRGSTTVFILGVALVAIYQIVAGIWAAQRRGKIKLLVIWAWCRIAFLLLKAPFALYAQFSPFRLLDVGRVLARNFIAYIIISGSLDSVETVLEQLVLPVVIVVLYWRWKRSASGRG